jgi:hypothetical protein
MFILIELHGVAHGSRDIRAQYDQYHLCSPEGAPLNITRTLQILEETNANTFSFLLWDVDGSGYLDLVRFLDYGSAHVDVWVTLIPPSEATGQPLKCSVPADSPLTAWDDTAFFNSSVGNRGCEDYTGWAHALSRLRQQYPRLTTVNIDDFSSNVGSAAFTQDSVAAVRKILNAQSIRLTPTFYYRGPGGEAGSFVLQQHPWLANATDGVLFYFRNDKRGGAECSRNCTTPVPTSCSRPCLYGHCAEASAANLADEVSDFAAALPSGTPIVVGIYFDAYHGCVAPSAQYNRDVLTQSMNMQSTAGGMVYITRRPAVPSGTSVGQWCASNPNDKGCVIRQVYAPQPYTVT